MKPLQYGPSSNAKDAQDLMRILHRVRTDPKRGKKSKSDLTGLLEKVIPMVLSDGR